MTQTVSERLRASVTYDYMPMQIRKRASDAASTIDALAAALADMVYETTHLSPMEDDGSHWCKISAEALAKSRAALAKARGEA